MTYNLKKKVNECELISVEIIFNLMFDKARVGGPDVAQNLHMISKKKKKKSRTMLRKEEKKNNWIFIFLSFLVL